MGLIGKIIDQVIGDNIREIVTEIFTNYTRVSPQVCPPGIDGAPVVGDQGFAVMVDKTGKTINVGVYPDAQARPGELRLYGRDADGALVFETYYKNDGTVNFGGTADNLVRFSTLETEFNKLRDAWDTFADAYAPGSPSTTGTPPTALASGADISGSKIDEIKTS